MDDDQQFCLRWNNHQSTLISVFDTLLENETLVDCTLAAEGKFLKAHKVVLSACSPYFATLLQEQYDKHPIFILKDVKYQELRAMMDYMYRGEVNISQDQLAALLKAAESLQIKGLSDNRSGGSNAAPKPDAHHRVKLSGQYTLEQTKRARHATGGAMDAGDVSGSREGSSSPSRRRRKIRRRSMENDVHDNSNSSVLQAAASNQSILQQAGAGLTAAALVSTQLASGSSAVAANAAALASGSSQVSNQPLTSSSNVTKKTESAKLTSTGAAQGAQQQQQQQQTSTTTTSDAINTDNVQQQQQQQENQGAEGDADDMDVGVASAAAVAAAHTGVVKQLEKSNHKQKIKDNSIQATEMVIEPKAEYDDDAHDENVEDLTLDEEDMTLEELDQAAGTSQGGEGSSQAYGAWQHDRSQDDLGLMAAQDAQQRDPQDLRTLYCNFATAVVAAAASKVRPTAAAAENSSSNCSSSNNSQTAAAAAATATAAATNLTEMREIYEPEITIRRMYKCGNNNNIEANATGTHNSSSSSNNNNNSHSNKLQCSASNCSGCQISAAAASYQFANLLSTSILLPAAAKTARCSSNNNNNNNNNSNSNNQLLKLSANKKSSVQLFHCEFCNFNCSWRYDLKLHLRQKHGIHQLKKS
ncbi:longitudinals lacking protein, isoforms H/M/V isoform X10 [Drosophila busckii]|uniref:longitudinals lacking protein, isoforms H/M/V isoform X10 n=1 Tax=Drosophila busckii TaxID=30019 RepID=UPI00083EDA5E|nr:longitudinals lacking protein, isoforms H/M/V isoform X10 [Drosophila busckii]